MITVKLFFETGLDGRSVVKNLLKLPTPIRPVFFTEDEVYFKEDEGKIVKANVLSNERRFNDFLQEHQLGFFLYTEDRKTECHLQTGSGYNMVDIDIESRDHGIYITDIIMCLDELNPVFGFSCDLMEYYHRHRYCIKIGPWSIESWIGRDLKKYVSGVFWYTLLSDVLLDMHGVNLADLSAEAISTETIGDGSLHLLRFFDRPEEWQQNKQRLDDLCERVDGVFSRRPADQALNGVTSLNEYDEVHASWR